MESLSAAMDETCWNATRRFQCFLAFLGVVVSELHLLLYCTVQVGPIAKLVLRRDVYTLLTEFHFQCHVLSSFLIYFSFFFLNDRSMVRLYIHMSVYVFSFTNSFAGWMVQLNEISVCFICKLSYEVDIFLAFAEYIKINLWEMLQFPDNVLHGKPFSNWNFKHKALIHLRWLLKSIETEQRIRKLVIRNQIPCNLKVVIIGNLTDWKQWSWYGVGVLPCFWIVVFLKNIVIKWLVYGISICYALYVL